MITGILASILISLVTIFYQNEVNKKTKVAFLSVMIVVMIASIFIFILVRQGHIQGINVIGDEKIKETNGYLGNIGINMLMV